MPHSKALPSYQKPPVIEVVCGILFQTLNKLLSPHMGLLWMDFKAEYSQLKEQMPLFPVVERFEEPAPEPPPPELSLLPLQRRVQFESQDETSLIQVQRDRFLYNWKKVRQDDVYPHYASVIKKFRSCLSRFESFLKKNHLGEIKPLQYELTYVNHIAKGEGWNTLNEIGKVFPDLAWKVGKERFLGDLEGFNWQASFRLPDQKGRLHSTIRHGIRTADQRPILLLDLTCRGIADDESRPAMWEWFDLAHEWIVRGFTDLTSSEIQRNVWRREDA